MKCLEPWLRKIYCRLYPGGSPARAGDRKLIKLATIHTSKSVTAHESVTPRIYALTVNSLMVCVFYRCRSLFLHHAAPLKKWNAIAENLIVVILIFKTRCSVRPERCSDITGRCDQLQAESVFRSTGICTPTGCQDQSFSYFSIRHWCSLLVLS